MCRWQFRAIQIFRDTMAQPSYISRMENGGRTGGTARYEARSSNRKEQLLSYSLSAPQNPRNAHSAITATTPLRIAPIASEPHVALIADNPSSSRNNIKMNHLRFRIIGDARSPIITQHVRANPRNNYNNPVFPVIADSSRTHFESRPLVRRPTLLPLQNHHCPVNSTANA